MDLIKTINAISDVIQNRPMPLRIFDQIYMKAGDMVLQSDMIAKWSNNKKLAFVGDGDAISICIAHLKNSNIIDYGPRKITVFDFDERICNAVSRFADREKINWLDARHYNCADPISKTIEEFDYFYTNPPWGQRNNGESVKVFIKRGIELIRNKGEGVIVIASDKELEWTQNVLARVQEFLLKNGFFVNEMMPELHSYHLDDAPDLKSCNIFVKSSPNNIESRSSKKLTRKQLENFYGKNNHLRVRFIKENVRLDYGKAHDDEYELVFYKE
ncbi:MAG: bis-aminopropyl spermidine synthase family protein [Deltaproteobacteria bacterium]|jgi:predicted methyltransferase|nr:bis-aminopropyl spermidine synthase family protein [Deltaproteobacteria bacterium]